MISRGAIGLFCLLALITGGLLIMKWEYPYGHRPACLPLMMTALMTYASEHDGHFPAGGSTPLHSLQRLYPKYAGRELAGLSGDIPAVVRRLSMGGVLDESISSWVYNEGFQQTDNPKIALIWETTPGIAFNASRTTKGSHAVGFVDGTMQQIPAEQWLAFLQEQDALRKEVTH